MIKNIIFDLGGVIITLDQPEAIRRFQQLGIADADQRLNA
jgi:putative hydrolase of the HAD superfamily